uniref:Putative secreted protein n=1 Tax=Anopheles darlingi TaxID=43151 RepID=A0A2M4DNT2_ANODA
MMMRTDVIVGAGTRRYIRATVLLVCFLAPIVQRVIVAVLVLIADATVRRRTAGVDHVRSVRRHALVMLLPVPRTARRMMVQARASSGRHMLLLLDSGTTRGG